MVTEVNQAERSKHRRCLSVFSLCQHDAPTGTGPVFVITGGRGAATPANKCPVGRSEEAKHNPEGRERRRRLFGSYPEIGGEQNT